MAKTVLLLFIFVTMRTGAQSLIQSPKCNGIIRGVVYGTSRQPAIGFQVGAFPLGIQFVGQLPKEKTDHNGEYKFEHVCHGTYTVIPADPEAGYPYMFPEENEFLYGTPIKSVKLTLFHSREELPVYLASKPGTVLLRVFNSKSNSEILKFAVNLKRSGQNSAEVRIEFDADTTERSVHVPSDKEVIVQVKADGAKEVSRSISTGSETPLVLNLKVESSN